MKTNFKTQPAIETPVGRVFAEIEEKDRQGIIMELIHCMPYIAAYLMDWIEMYSDNG